MSETVLSHGILSRDMGPLHIEHIRSPPLEYKRGEFN